MKKIAFVLLLASCDEPDTTSQFEPVEMTPDHAVEGNRFEVRFVQKVRDSIAYHGERGVYVIIDRETGKEYVGLSGVGISETGRHQVGKSMVSDER